jgi:3-oxoacyl-[acyl-carrier protein] reductase
LFGLDGQVAVVTGSASGIGAATARVLASAGADIVLATYPSDSYDVRPVRDWVTATGRRAVTVEVDVRSRQDVCRLVEAAVAELGRLDIVVANAAIARRRATLTMTEAEWLDIMDVNLAGVWRTFQAAVPHLQQTGGGRLLATTSTAGTLEAWEEHAHYCAAKAGLTGLVKTMAAELGPLGITVNAVAPGIIETPQTLDEVNSLGAAGIAATAATQPVRRTGRPEDIAYAFAYLASREASFVTGHVLVVDGGRTLVR